MGGDGWQWVQMQGGLSGLSHQPLDIQLIVTSLRLGLMHMAPCAPTTGSELCLQGGAQRSAACCPSGSRCCLAGECGWLPADLLLQLPAAGSGACDSRAHTEMHNTEALSRWGWLPGCGETGQQTKQYATSGCVPQGAASPEVTRFLGLLSPGD